ncbi:MAG: DUF3750 domain-containing protein [Methylobacterium sp.]|uniref:DUF3750 domain-containing protein n=1 Tax=Methylobacterium sp. TaxID=409 RepID=UPI0025E473AF|nr:DUF3750 domain-containing protein [Methylobacterium sp.]MBX9932934.1 DUF3750 domain-containing protein [Methylobacterium sp.]
MLRFIVLAFIGIYLVPIALSAALYLLRVDRIDWRIADKSSAGFLTAAADYPEAVVRVFSARTVSWRGIVASHSWIVVKPARAPAYRRFDYTAWGLPIWIDRFVPDGRWFGSVPEIVFAADGEEAERMIPLITSAVSRYRFAQAGDYTLWPGPNSNTFVAAVMSAVPGIQAPLPVTAIGKDFPADGRWVGLTPSGTGARITLGGYAGVTVAWVEGIEINILGAVAGIDLRRPGIKLPGLGRLGL